MTMNPSEYEIQLEVEALRDIRRRSINPGALTIDPDLPNQSTSQNPYWSSPSSTENDSSSSSSHEDSSSSGHTDSSSHRDDPFHLFWVPASVHPEIAPAEFRAFLKEHARSPPPADGSQSLSRSSSLSSMSSSGLGRKRSMLSRQYRPTENDGVEETEEKIVPLRRNRSTLYHNQGPQLTINDLQRLEQLAEEASESDDPTKLRSVLRRSLSLNVSPTALEKMDRVPEMGDEADAPIIVPPPGLILRRAARTKIRKPSLPGDGDGHRFGSTRRRTSARAGVPERPSGDQGDHSEPLLHKRVQSLSEASDATSRPSQDSFDEALIYDAYARDDEEEPQASTSPPIPSTISPPPLVEVQEAPKPSTSPTLPEPEVQPSLLEALGPIVHAPQPQRLLSPQSSTEPTQQTSRTPSPSSPGPSSASPVQPPAQAAPPQQTPQQQQPQPQPQPSFLDTPPTPQQLPPTRKEKDKKGLFGKWGSDKSSKRHAKEKDKDKDKDSAQQTQEPKEKEKEKESGFFGSLFSKKSSKESSSSSSQGHDSHAHGRETAAAMFGANKSSKGAQPPTPGSPGFGAPAPGGGIINNYSRYPLHVERAIYRLSHIKLANPRRPLYEQVLISNLMFWYLGVINKAQGQQQQQQQQQAQQQMQGQPAQQAPGMNGPVTPENEREAMDTQQRSLEKERLEQQQQQQLQQAEPRHNGNYSNSNTNSGSKRESSPKRGSLTKAAPAGQGGRRAEMAVRGPQYDMQHRAMEQEYSGYGQPQQRGSPQPQSWGYQPQPQQQQYGGNPPRLVQQQQQEESPFYYSVDMAQAQQQPQQRLPPGAMPPVDQQAWSPSPSSKSPPPGSQAPTSSPHRTSRSPPPQQGLVYHSNGSAESFGEQTGNGGIDGAGYGKQQQHRGPGRSLSATALPSQSSSANGRLKKGASASAAVPSHRGRTRSNEANGAVGEEDMPLAMYQQQRRR